MPVIILLGRSKTYLKELSVCLSTHFTVVHLNDEFRTIRSRLSNMDPNVAYVIDSCDMKPQRYEIYCLAKRNETSYCVLTDEKLSIPKYEMPVFDVGAGLPVEEILCCLESKLSCSVAHRKRVVGSNYMMQLKQIMNKVNEQMPKGSEVVLRDCENKIMRLQRLSPIDLDEFEDAYREIVQNELRSKGFE